MLILSRSVKRPSSKPSKYSCGACRGEGREVGSGAGNGLYVQVRDIFRYKTTNIIVMVLRKKLQYFKMIYFPLYCGTFPSITDNTIRQPTHVTVTGILSATLKHTYTYTHTNRYHVISSYIFSFTSFRPSFRPTSFRPMGFSSDDFEKISEITCNNIYNYRNCIKIRFLSV